MNEFPQTQPSRHEVAEINASVEELKHNQKMFLDPNKALHLAGEEAEALRKRYDGRDGYSGTVAVAFVRAGDEQEFRILCQTNDATGEKRYLVDVANQEGFAVEIPSGDESVIGRNHHNKDDVDRDGKGFDYSLEVSREHFKVGHDDEGSVYVENLKPLNKTEVVGFPVPEEAESQEGKVKGVLRRLGRTATRRTQ